MEDLLKKRFGELEQQSARIEASKRPFIGMGGARFNSVDTDLVFNWSVKVKSLLSKACGTDSPHLSEFAEAEKTSSYEDSSQRFSKMKAVFLAAKEDYEGGYLTSLRHMVRAEVFDSELEQATELLNNGYNAAAGVIAGVVLETTIRDLCSANHIPHGKLDKMNADLTKAGIYNGIMQKRITHLAAIRNSAAHGNQAEFKTSDVTAMIDEVEKFLAAYVR